MPVHPTGRPAHFVMICSSCGFENRTPGASCGACGQATLVGPDVHEAATAVRSGDTPMAPRRRDNSLEPNGTFAGRYKVLRILGRGGMGTVYEVIDDQARERRALKVLHSDVAEEGAYERFRREIETLSKVRHPAVPRVYEWGVEPEGLYFVCDLVGGDNLRAIVKKSGPLPLNESVEICATVAEALHAAHCLGIAHRDVKPHNIMIDENRNVFLLDFGVARSMGLELKQITMTGMVVGTPDYMSPEQFEARRIDGRSDIYSLGVVLFELVTGKLPFVADTPVSLAIKHQTELPQEPRQIKPSVPAWLDRVILRCLEKDPQRRYLTAEDLVHDLRKERKGHRQSKLLPSGDRMMLDDSETEKWALVLVSRREKKNWSLGMALEFGERYYRLDDLESDGKEKWMYRFSHWPPEQIFRKVVNYEDDVIAQLPKVTLASRVRSWLGH